MDSTDVKVYGDGEWKVRQHGVGKRRTWRKLHLCVDETTLEIISIVFKTIFGDRLQSRQIDNQFKELLLKSTILNQTTHLASLIASRLPANKSFKARIDIRATKPIRL